MKERYSSVNIILSTREIFSDIEPMREMLHGQGLSPEIILTHLFAQWFGLQGDESYYHYYLDMSMTAMMEIYAIEDLVIRGSNTNDGNKVSMAVIKHLTQRFMNEMVPTLESMDIAASSFQTARLLWSSTNVILDIKG